MKVRLKDIGPDGLRVARDFDKTYFHEILANVEAYLDQAAGRAEMMVTKTGAQIFVHGTVRARFHVPCGRCLEAAEVCVDGPVSVTYMPEALATQRQESQEDALIEGENVDVATYRGAEFDLSDLVRDQILLGVPMVGLCRSDCRGLCVRCGANLNLGPCGCPPRPEETPLGRLGSMRRPV